MAHSTFQLKMGDNKTMDHKPEVSIIMGVFNGAATLRTAVESIRQQTFADWEFIICDDCSTDHTLKILKEIELNDDLLNKQFFELM